MFFIDISLSLTHTHTRTFLTWNIPHTSIQDYGIVFQPAMSLSSYELYAKITFNIVKSNKIENMNRTTICMCVLGENEKAKRRETEIGKLKVER